MDDDPTLEELCEIQMLRRRGIRGQSGEHDMDRARYLYERYPEEYQAAGERAKDEAYLRITGRER